MTHRSKFSDPADDPEFELTVSPEAVCFIIVKAREFDAKDANTGDDTGSSASDDHMMSVLEDHDDDPVVNELTSFISSLSDDQQIDLVALAWVGRDDYTIDDWQSLRDEAASVHGTYRKRTAAYLLGMPMLGDYLEEGLSMFGKSCEDYEIDRL